MLVEDSDDRHSRAGGNPMLPGILVSRLRENDVVEIRKLFRAQPLTASGNQVTEI